MKPVDYRAGDQWPSGKDVVSKRGNVTAREKHVTAQHLLLHIDEIKHVWHQRRWAELAAVVEYAKKDVPVILSKTDPYLYQALRAAVTEFNVRGFDRLNLAKLQALADKAEREQNPGLT